MKQKEFFFFSQQKAIVLNGKLKGENVKTKGNSILPLSIVYRLEVCVRVRFITQIVYIFILRATCILR